MSGIAPTSTRDSEIEQHVAESDPHTQYQRESEKGANDGYASLDANGDVPVDQIRDLATTIAGSFPGFSTLVTVPTTVKGRQVTAVVDLTATGSNTASIELQVETAVGSGVYTNVSQFAMEAVAATRVGTLSFLVPAGHRYQFVEGGLAGVSEAVSVYSYTDL